MAGDLRGDLPTVQLHAPGGSAQLTLQGAHLLHYQPADHPPVLWVSHRSRFAHGQAIRGGIPICWPWFADETDDPKRPMHGLARTRFWEAIRSHADEHQTQLVLALRDDPETRALWPHPFELELTITLADHLAIALIHRNTDAQTVRCTGALHTYFAISHIKNIHIKGLENTSYIDKVDGRKTKTQNGPLTPQAHTDRIYTPAQNHCTLHDGPNRQIRIESTGSRSTVVWNPWDEKAKAMEDYGDGEYLHMVCVETANAGDDVVLIQPGNQHELGAKIIPQSL